jgi:hypothetical protein
MSERYIWIRNWHKFQHYGNHRTPPWIKSYIELLSDDHYLNLSHHQRGVLHGLWLAFASSRRQLILDTRSLSRRLNGRVTTQQLEALIDAGFIEVIASNVLAERLQDASPEQNREEDIKKKQTEQEILPDVRSVNHQAALDRLTAVLDEVDANTPTVLSDAAAGLSPEQIDAIRLDVAHTRVRTTRTRYAIGRLRRIRRAVPA